MNFKYVPVLRNLLAEREAIAHINISDKITPLIEIVLEKHQKIPKKISYRLTKVILSYFPIIFLLIYQCI